MTKREAEYLMYRFAAGQLAASDLDLDTDHPDMSQPDRIRMQNAREAVVLHLRACADRIKLGEKAHG